MKNRIGAICVITLLAVQPGHALTLSNETLFVAKKFILAMVCIVIASLLIFIGLWLYNKLFHNPAVNEKTTYDEKSLEQAKSLDTAISNFLNRTKM